MINVGNVILNEVENGGSLFRTKGENRVVICNKVENIFRKNYQQ